MEENTIFRPIGIHPENIIERYIIESLSQQTSTLAQAVASTQALKSQLQQMDSHFQNLTTQLVKEPTQASSSTSHSSLLKLLQGEAGQVYHKLKLSKFPSKIGKNKFFAFSVYLQSLCDFTPNPADSFPVHVQLYTSQASPTPIDHTKNGQPILDTENLVLHFIESKRRHGAHLRIRINEVTSHFFNGWVYIAITVPGLEGVKPLVISDVKVISKSKVHNHECP